MFRFIRKASHDKGPPACPELDQLLHIYFGQDFDLWGNTIEELVGCYKRDSPVKDHQALLEEIARFRQTHSQDLDAAFHSAYPNETNPAGWGHTTDSFLTEVERLLRDPGTIAPPE
jgi:hypothetical protein